MPPQQLATLQRAFEGLAEAYLVPEFRAVDPNISYGYTGSFRTGVVRNRTKATFGQPIDLLHFDIDFWIKIDILYGPSGLTPELGQIISVVPALLG